MSFENEILLTRLRMRPSRLWFGHLVLALVFAVLTWASLRPLAGWITLSIDIACGIAVFIFWLIPAWRFVSNSVTVTNKRIVVRGGVFARVQADVQVSAISGIDYVRGSGVILHLGDAADPVVLSGLSRPKALAEALRKTLAK